MLYSQTTQRICTQTLDIPNVGRSIYTLFADPLPNGQRSYSIRVELDGPTGRESRTVHELTTNEQLALHLFWQVCRGTVTPCTLLEVLPELLP